jgi:tetratricopeptide (TPR) repeat protein
VACWEEALALCRELGSKNGTAWALYYLGDVALYQGEIMHALALYNKSLKLFQELRYKFGIPPCLLGFAGVASASGQAERGAQLYGASEALREAMGHDIPPHGRISYDRIVATIRTQLDEAAFAAAWAAGQAMTSEQAIAYAFENNG